MTEEKQLSKIEALHKFSKDVMQIWKSPEEIRPLFAPDLTDQEFRFFCGLGISLGANPFKREIWAVKYDKTKPAAIFTGRDFNRRKAQEQKDYDGHVVDSVYTNDKFKVENNNPFHEWALKDRGEISGAYFMGWRKNVKQPFFLFVKFSEYNKHQSSWNQMPDTMIKKVAEAQGLRMMFQGIFSGTYDEAEVYDNDFTDVDQQALPTAELDNRLFKTEQAPASEKAMKEVQEKFVEDEPPFITDEDESAGRFQSWSELDEKSIKEALNALRTKFRDNKEKMAEKGYDTIGKFFAKHEVKVYTPKDMTPKQYWAMIDEIDQ